MPQDVFGEHIQNASVTDPGQIRLRDKDSHLIQQIIQENSEMLGDFFFGVFVGMFDENSSRLIPFKSSLAQR